jgi:hypothetical protein
MISIAPATGPNHTAQLGNMVLSAGSCATKAAAVALAMGEVALQIQTITLKIETSNRGVGIGVKNAFAGANYSVNKAVIERRNTLAGTDNQFPVPTKPANL